MITIFGYWRCSTDAQDQERQIRALSDAGCEKIVGDKITGTSIEVPVILSPTIFSQPASDKARICRS